MPDSARETPEIDIIRAAATPWQRRLSDRLVGLQRSGRLPHALLVNPATGIDCSPFGWYLVSALLCRDVQTPTPCGDCVNCRLMAANTHPDLTYTTLVDNERTHKLNRDIRIEQIRRLIHQLSLTANDPAGKFALLYPAERMNQASANSLLKTLEEPAAATTLILLTNKPGRLPVTIRSRCQQWSVSRPQAPEARDWLVEEGVEAGVVEDYLQLAAGEPQLALTLYAQKAFEHLQKFQQGLKAYLKTGADLLPVVDELKPLPEALVILIVRRTLLSFVYQQLQRDHDRSVRKRLVDLLDLLREAEFNLQGTETNLIVNLQLEDVLISLKQILTGENRHASTR